MAEEEKKKESGSGRLCIRSRESRQEGRTIHPQRPGGRGSSGELSEGGLHSIETEPSTHTQCKERRVDKTEG